MLIPLIVAVIFYYIVFRNTASKVLAGIISAIVFLALSVVFGSLPLSWVYKNAGSGTDEKELSFFESFYNGELIYQRVEKKDICIYQEIDGDKQILDSDFYIIENDQKGAYVVKHYSEKLIRRSWAPWVLSLIYFIHDKELCYYDYHKFYLPRCNQVEFQFYQYTKLE